MGKLTTGAVIGGAVGGLLIAAAQTSPEDAASNLAGWLHILGIDRLPSVFDSTQIDSWATLAGVVLVVAAAAYLVRHFQQNGTPQKIRWGRDRPEAFGDEFDYLARNSRGVKVERDTPLGEALAYIALGEWGHSYAEAFNALFDGRARSPSRPFHQAARDEEIIVWGKGLRNGVYEKIPPEHWSKHHVDEQALIQNARARTRWADIHGSDGVTYDDLMVSRAQIEALFSA